MNTKTSIFRSTIKQLLAVTKHHIIFNANQANMDDKVLGCLTRIINSPDGEAVLKWCIGIILKGSKTLNHPSKKEIVKELSDGLIKLDPKAIMRLPN